MRLDDKLWRNYNELYDLILCCYRDVSILKVYETLQEENNDFLKMTPKNSKYYVLLLQKDLVLTLWKLYCDNDKNAETIQKFRNDIKKKDRSIELEKLEIINPNTIRKIEQMRNQYLAHTDMTRKGSRIEIAELKKMLDTICREFNKVSKAIGDDRIKNSEILKAEIDLQVIGYEHELRLIYNQKVE